MCQCKYINMKLMGVSHLFISWFVYYLQLVNMFARTILQRCSAHWNAVTPVWLKTTYRVSPKLFCVLSPELRGSAGVYMLWESCLSCLSCLCLQANVGGRQRPPFCLPVWGSVWVDHETHHITAHCLYLSDDIWIIFTACRLKTRSTERKKKKHQWASYWITND